MLVPDEVSGFSAEILEFPGCVAEGGTEAEAFANLERAALDWIDAAKSQGLHIPPPKRRSES